MLNSGAAPLSHELIKTLFEKLNIKIKQSYGLSETSSTVFSQPHGDWQSVMGSVGKLMPNMEARLASIADHSSEARSGSPAKKPPLTVPGELHVRGPNVFPGYLNKPAETVSCRSSDGWFQTGDVGYFDARQNFFITDRMKELIKYKGFQVAPAELESYLLQHELVADVAVVGLVRQELGTEVPQAFVVRRGGMAARKAGDEEEIVGWLAKRVSNHKKLRGGVRFIREIPRNPSGKIMRRVLRQHAQTLDAEGRSKLKLKSKL